MVCCHRSDLSDADIEGADFTNALLDKPMQTVRCALCPVLRGEFHTRCACITIIDGQDYADFSIYTRNFRIFYKSPNVDNA